MTSMTDQKLVFPAPKVLLRPTEHVVLRYCLNDVVTFVLPRTANAYRNTTFAYRRIGNIAAPESPARKTRIVLPTAKHFNAYRLIGLIAVMAWIATRSQKSALVMSPALTACQAAGNFVAAADLVHPENTALAK